MYKLVYTNRFKRDVKLAIKRGKKIERLSAIVSLLCAGKQLPVSCRDHALSGKYSGFRDCHIEPDWILIYRFDQDQLQLIMARTGTHANLF